MRIETAPRVYLIARPALAEGFYDFLQEEGLDWPTEAPGTGVPAAQQLTEMAGRICYMSFGAKAGSKTNRAYIDNLTGMSRPGIAHGSVCEHANYSFLVCGAGRGFSHEQVRHRPGWAYSQLSTRYCDFERSEEDGTWDPGFTIPPLAQLHPNTKAKFEARLRQSRDFYVEMLGEIESDLKNHREFMKALETKTERERNLILRKAARGAARDILPNATEAIMFQTANVRAIYNAGVMRASEAAEAEIRSVYVQILKIMQVEFPAVFDQVKFVQLWDGSEAAVMPREKL